jgi:hypothetical protein
MALDEQQLSILLQAGIEKASELLEHDGGFLPFGARAKPSGEIQFIQLGMEEGETPGSLHRRLGEMLAAEAGRGELLGSALVAETRISGEADTPALAVLIETIGFSRSVVVPYRAAAGKVDLGSMVPAEAEPVVFRN